MSKTLRSALNEAGISHLYSTIHYGHWEGGAVAQSVERATPGQEVPRSIPALAACPSLVGSVSVKCDRLR